MNILILSGSPRKGGNTELLADGLDGCSGIAVSKEVVNEKHMVGDRLEVCGQSGFS